MRLQPAAIDGCRPTIVARHVGSPATYRCLWWCRRCRQVGFRDGIPSVGTC